MQYNKVQYRVFVWKIAVKIPSQKTHLGNLTCDFPDDCSSWFYTGLGCAPYTPYTLM